MSNTNFMLEELIETTGGLGRFQGVLMSIIFIGETSTTWTMLMMTFAGVSPDWWCTDGALMTEKDNHTSLLRTCKTDNVTCSNISFADNWKTVVSDWQLVCDQDWIGPTITTIQMSGVLVGGVGFGQLSDAIGRKPSYFIALTGLLVFNVVAFFSTSWVMFAAVRFLLGLSAGGYLLLYFTWSIEYLTSKWRPLAGAIPSWALEAGAFGLVAWIVPNWRYLHIAAAVATAPFLLCWRFMPESFRWLASNGEIEKAEDIIIKMAQMNRRPIPDLTDMKRKIKLDVKRAEKEREHSIIKKYTLVDLVKTWDMAKLTFILMGIWISCGYGYFGISFGVSALSGNLFVNIFLMGIMDMPGNFLILYTNNCIGRKKTSIMMFVLAGVSAAAAGTMQNIEALRDGVPTNVLALVAKLFCVAGWHAMMLYTTELYPTVIRNIGYGFQSTMSRVGSMIAPQVVLLDKSVPGIMFFLCGGTMIASALLTLLLVETMDKPLPNMFKSQKNVETELELCL